MKKQQVKGILMITSYPPRECGIASYSRDLLHAIKRKFGASFSMSICALESGTRYANYSGEVVYTLNSTSREQYAALADRIDEDDTVDIVFIQHEFGLFSGVYGEDLLEFLLAVNKPVYIAFHTVLPSPNLKLYQTVQLLARFASGVVVMTNNSRKILSDDYHIPEEKLSVIPHGTHIVKWNEKDKLKKKYGLEDKLILSNFGLLSSNKSIETAIKAMPRIISDFPNAVYLVLGKTHPGVIRHEGEKYREYLYSLVRELSLGNNVKFVNDYLEPDEILEFLKLTDVYLFTSKDPNQAVSGTFSYAMSSGCPIVSTKIPHAVELLSDDCGRIIDFNDVGTLARHTIELLTDSEVRKQMSRNALHKVRCTSWENVAIKHAQLFDAENMRTGNISYKYPDISLKHIYEMTDDKGIIQFSDICQPDIMSGYTLDDNARALVALCLHYSITGDKQDKRLIWTYLNFIAYCQLPDGKFINYVDKNGIHTEQNRYINLEDSNGRAIWALGTVIFYGDTLGRSIRLQAEQMMKKAYEGINNMRSPRSMAFAIKGLYMSNQVNKDFNVSRKIDELAGRLMNLYNEVHTPEWKWYETKLTYANAVLPEAMALAYLETGNTVYRDVAKCSFDFLLSKIMVNDMMVVISNRGWLDKDAEPPRFGEQPIDVAYTIFTLELFVKIFDESTYRRDLELAFNWFLGHNRLGHVMYNSLTGGCYDGLEEHSVNLNQGAESTICFLLSRLVMERFKSKSTGFNEQGKLKIAWSPRLIRNRASLSREEIFEEIKWKN